jgi:hypothetical protein
MPEITQMEYERLRQPEDPPRFEQWVEAQGNHLPDRIRIRLLQAAMDNEPVGRRFNAMNWNVLDLSGSRFRLLTSDWPLHKTVSGQNMLLALPISPTALFTATTRPEIFERMRRMAADDLVRLSNTAVVSCARLYVYGHDRSQERFIGNRMSTTMVVPPFFPSLAQTAEALRP